MRIGVDATHVTPDGKGHALSQRKAVEGLAGAGHDVVAFVRAAGAGLLGVETHVVRSPKTILWELVELPLARRRLGLDVVLTFSERLPLRGGPYVVWLFELPTHRIGVNRAQRASRHQRASDAVTAALWQRGLRRAAFVVAGSSATRRELLDLLPELEARTRVVYPAVREGFSPGPAPDTPPYVFHLSSADPRDNTETVLAAFAAARRDGERLVVGGGLGTRLALLERERDRLGLAEAVVFTGRLSDEDLRDRYRGAQAYVDASLYEGFGYQVLEALACGAPVVASAATSIPEVVGDAGLLCDPREPSEIASALRRVLDDATLAAELRARAVAQAARFSWERTIRGLAQALEDAAG